MPSRLARTLRRVAPRRRPDGPDVACRAPFTSLYLDQRGYVRACCMNDFHTLGNVAERPLTEIWHGEEARALRAAMVAHDLGLGCDFCQWQFDEGHPERSFARWFADLPLATTEPEWPRQLELSISNTCNLQCAMCNGEWSSSIRAQREGLPPLPKVYDDAFFADLVAFLPHLDRIKFLGGEPFLAAETLRVMELIVAEGLATPCHVTTNGSQWTPRVERILDLVPVDVAVSVDAATGPTYERIRQGASWDVLVANLERFRAHAARRGTDVTLTFCLMTANWQEFGDFCRWADDLGLGCAVNTVTQPDALSLFHLEAGELAPIVAALQAPGAGPGPGRSRPVWDAEVAKLEHHLAERRAGRPVTGVDVRRERSHAVADPRRRGPDPERTAAAVERAAALRDRHVGAGAARLELDGSGVVVGVPPSGDVVGVEPARFLGRRPEEIEVLVGEAVAPVRVVEHERHGGDVDLVTVHLVDGRRVHVVSTPPLDGVQAEGTWLWFDWGPAEGPPPAG